MIEADTEADIVVVLRGDRRLPRALRGLPVVTAEQILHCRRVIVVGADAELAAVLTALLRADTLDVEVGFVPGRRGARRARRGAARRVPLIRDDTGAVIVGSATWRGAGSPLHGEAVVDDTTLFDGQVRGVRVEPTRQVPGLRAAVLGDRGRPRGWVHGRAAQLGTTGAVVCRDGVESARPVKRSTFYRHTKGWMRVG